MPPLPTPHPSIRGSLRVPSRPSKQVMGLTNEEALHQRVAAALAGKSGYHLLQRTGDPGDAYALGVQGVLDIILLDRRLGGDDALVAVRELKQRLPEVPIVVLADADDADYVRRALLAGARAFLPLQFAPASLIQTVDDLAGSGSAVPGGGPAGRVVVVAGLKGGVGRTLVATNLAVALGQARKKPVVLVDGQLLYGDAEIVLNLSPLHSIADLVEHVDSLEPELLDEALARHASGLRVLAASNDADAIARLQAKHVGRILAGLRRQYAWVVVDTGNWLDDRLDSFLDAADVALLVTTPEMTSLRAARVFLQMAREQSYPQDKIRLVLNRADLLGAIPRREIERSLGMPAFASLSDDSALVTYSINRGVPLVISHARKPLARALTGLAERLVEELAPVEEEQRGGLFVRRSRGSGG